MAESGWATWALLDPIVAGRASELRGLAIADRGDGPPLGAGDLVLGIGVTEARRAIGLVRDAAGARAAGVVLRASVAEDPDVTAAAVGYDMPLFGLRHRAAWMHLIEVLRAAIANNGDPSPAEGEKKEEQDDLFGLADAIAKSLGAPVTIEDTTSRVLAYSAQPTETDPARISTIVGRQVPADVVAHFRSQGVFRKLMRSDEPVFVPGAAGGILPRLIVPVRAGGEWLGSIWAVVDGPVERERLAALTGAARVLAVHLIRLRMQQSLAERVAREELRGVLREYDPAVQVHPPLPPGPWRVAALSRADGATGVAAGQVELWASLMRRHGLREPRVVDVDGVVCTVLSETQGPERHAPAGSLSWFRATVESLGQELPGSRAGIGTTATTLAELGRSRAEAAEVLGLFGAAGPGAITRTYEEAWAEIVLSRVIRPVSDPDVVVGPLSVLVRHDVEHGTDYVRTLEMWLAHPAEPRRAAASLHIHPNTLRHRLQRMRALVELDLDNPRATLALRIQADSVRRSGPSRPPTPRPR